MTNKNLALAKLMTRRLSASSSVSTGSTVEMSPEAARSEPPPSVKINPPPAEAPVELTPEEEKLAAEVTIDDRPSPPEQPVVTVEKTVEQPATSPAEAPVELTPEEEKLAAEVTIDDRPSSQDTPPAVPKDEAAAISAYEALLVAANHVEGRETTSLHGRIVLRFLGAGEQSPMEDAEFREALALVQCVVDGKRPSVATHDEVTEAASTVLTVAERLRALRTQPAAQAPVTTTQITGTPAALAGTTPAKQKTPQEIEALQRQSDELEAVKREAEELRRRSPTPLLARKTPTREPEPTTDATPKAKPKGFVDVDPPDPPPPSRKEAAKKHSPRLKAGVVAPVAILLGVGILVAYAWKGGVTWNAPPRVDAKAGETSETTATNAEQPSPPTTAPTVTPTATPTASDASSFHGRKKMTSEVFAAYANAWGCVTGTMERSLPRGCPSDTRGRPTLVDASCARRLDADSTADIEYWDLSTCHVDFP